MMEIPRCTAEGSSLAIAWEIYISTRSTANHLHRYEPVPSRSSRICTRSHSQNGSCIFLSFWFPTCSFFFSLRKSKWSQQSTAAATAESRPSCPTPVTTPRKSRAVSPRTRNSNTNAVNQFLIQFSKWNRSTKISVLIKDLGYNTLGFARARCLQYNQTVKWFGPDVTCEGQCHCDYLELIYM